MRILVLSSEYWHTGSSMRAYQLSRALSGIGHEAEFISPPALPGRLRSEMLGSMIRYAGGSSRGRYDLVVAVKPYPSAALPGLLAADRDGSILVIDIDDLDQAYREGWRSTAIRALQSPFPRRADLVTYHNHQLGRYLREARGLTPHKTTYLEQGVDTSLFNPKRPELAGAAEEAERDGKLVVNLCHFDAAADLEELLWSISLAVDEEPGIRSAIVGGGPLLGEFRARVGNSPLKGCVSLPGPLPQDEVVKLVAAANTCTVFYKDRRANRYRSSLKLREYLAMGKKVVCTDSGELSSFSPYTYQTPPDVAEFADELVRVVGLPRSRRAIRGLRHVRSRCSWESIARRFVDRVESL